MTRFSIATFDGPSASSEAARGRWCRLSSAIDHKEEVGADARDASRLNYDGSKMAMG